MFRWARWLTVVALVLAHGLAFGSASVEELAQRLRSGADFRVKVQAALELGKTGSPEARAPLEGALDDQHQAVRTAAASALRVLGDPRAVPALERRLGKEKASSARSAIEAAIGALGKAKPQVLVQLGSVTVKDRKVQALKPAVEAASRAKLGELPGVAVVAPDADGLAEAKRLSVPLVLVTGRLKELAEKRQGSEVTLSASFELLVHRMPEQSISGSVRGSASTSASADEVADKKRAAELQRTVVDAAVASAIRRAPQALLAASR